MAVKCHKIMKEKVDLHLEFLKQTSSLNTMKTPLMTVILWRGGGGEVGKLEGAIGENGGKREGG